MGVMPLTALKEATAPKAADAGTAALRAPRDLLPTQVRLTIHRELATVEHEWRHFEQFADCTVFQTFDWLSIWQKHIGQRHRVIPAIVVGRFANGDIAFLLPFCIERHYGLRRLRWLGQDLCDYNAPLLACDFSERVEPDRFLRSGRFVEAQMQSDPLLRHDWIDFEKCRNRSAASSIRSPISRSRRMRAACIWRTSTDDWEKFYVAKRSSSTRRRDRTKRAHMSEHGDIRFVTATDPDDARRTSKR